MNDWTVPTDASDWEAAYEYADAQARHPWPPRDARTCCGNPNCDALCESLFCTPTCREAVEGPDPYPEAAAVAPVPTFTEAPVSCTVKGVHHGQDTMITIRGTDFASVQAQLEAACAWFDVPAKPAQSTPVETGESFCAIHQVPMRYNVAKNGGKDWYSHRVGEGQFCKGKGVKP